MDLFEHGWDILDFFRGQRPFSQLVRLANRLPAHSRYVAALMDDPVVAEALAARTDDAEHLTMAGYDPVRALLSSLLDAVNWQTAVLVAANSQDGRVPEVSPAPRPRTEVDRVRERHREQGRRALVALALGKDVTEV